MNQMKALTIRKKKKHVTIREHAPSIADLSQHGNKGPSSTNKSKDKKKSSKKQKPEQHQHKLKQDNKQQQNSKN